jgi:anaerobic magnesium-protoporphyrin IX monomethyl ester cyclase
MNILLIWPQIQLRQAYSYGLGYISAVLKQGGHAVDCAVLRDPQDTVKLLAKIEKQKPKLIGFSALSNQINYLGPIIAAIKEICDVFIVCGGIHPSVKPECITEISGVDAIARGEGEFALLELVDALENKENIFPVRNFWLKRGEAIIKNDVRPPVNLDQLPFPDKDILDYQLLLDQNRSINRFIFSRGCPFDCPYCSNKALRQIYKENEYCFRFLSPERAIEEIALDADRFKFNTIFFDDDIISLNKKWFYEFFTLYKGKFKYPFYCNVRVGTLDADMIRLLKEAGAKGVAIGIEHGNEKFRKSVLRRNITDKQITDTLKLCQDHGIKDNYGQIMVGLPFENRELFLDTVRLCRRLNINYFCYIFSPYPATEFGELCKKNNWLPRHRYYSERQQAVIDYPTFSKEDIQLCHDLFGYLVRFRFLPLKVPWMPTGLLLRFYNFIINVGIPIKSLLKKSLNRARNKTEN